MPVSRRTDKEDVEHKCNGTNTQPCKACDVAICSNMDGPREQYMLSKTKDKYRMITYMWNPKNNTNNCICKTGNTDIENKPVVAKCKKEAKGTVAQSCLPLCHPTDCTSPGSSVHEIFQARKLDWVAISSSLAYLKSLSRVRLFVTPWTVQSVKFSRPEYWSG